MLITIVVPLWLVGLLVLYLLAGLWLALAVRQDPDTLRFRVSDWIICLLAGVPLVAECLVEGWVRARSRK